MLFTINVPFEQYDQFEVEAETVEEAIEIARLNPEKRTAVNIDDTPRDYDWDSAMAQDEDENDYDSDGKKI